MQSESRNVRLVIVNANRRGVTKRRDDQKLQVRDGDR
jgi:hypothetical protein